MSFLAGIDEAGYGPLLGPFVVGYSLFRVPNVDIDLWPALEPIAVRKPARSDRRLWLDDSKRVHQGPHGRSRLERTVSAFHRAGPKAPESLRGWIGRPPTGRTTWFARAPWFRKLEGRLCPGADRQLADLDGSLVRRALVNSGCALEDFGARVVTAAEWNELNRQTGSKGDTLFQVTLEVVRHLLQLVGDAPLRLELDRHGARLRYAERLADGLSPDRIETHGERRGGSAYTLHFGSQQVQLRFSENADQNFLPVALASLAAKQSRERLMDCWNAWFAERLPHIKPTKGYALDAKRWIADTEEHLPEMGVPEELVRRFR